ncbi:MAG TPA: response regulator [Bryobacterales bacterium]|nr:response regulator [Bryobacterales bacterium]
MPANNHDEKTLQSVLLVEDDPDYSDLLHQAFLEAGFRILQADNGERALEVLRNEQVDLVVSDFIMPELNGLELCRLLNNDLQFSRVKVVLYSCNADIMFRRRARELGALDYLLKTDDARTMVKQVCEVAGLNGKVEHSEAAVGERSRAEEALHSVAGDAEELRVLLDNFLDFVKIAVPAEPLTPGAQVAWDAAQRTAGEMKRLLGQMGKQVEEVSNGSVKK